MLPHVCQPSGAFAPARFPPGNDTESPVAPALPEDPEAGSAGTGQEEPGEFPNEGLDQLDNWVRLAPTRMTSPGRDSELCSSRPTRD